MTFSGCSFPYFAGFLHATRLRGMQARHLGSKGVGELLLACIMSAHNPDFFFFKRL
jgi:hypothetical protein